FARSQSDGQRVKKDLNAMIRSMLAAAGPICHRKSRSARPLGRRARQNSLRLEWLEDRTLLSTFIVTGTDGGGPGQPRQAILDSNAIPGSDVVNFDIPGEGVHTIEPTSGLPAITEPVLINGWSQPRSSGTPRIVIDPSSSGLADGLTIAASDVTVRG